MKSLTPLQAFGEAPPRSAAVLCVPGPNGSTDMILTEWFTWLNYRRNPMLSYSMHRSASLGLSVEPGSKLYLAFPPAEEALAYKAGVRTAAKGQEKEYPEGVKPVRTDNVPVEIPEGSTVVLCCTLERAYNYPFKKVRIFNCDLDEARGERS